MSTSLAHGVIDLARAYRAEETTAHETVQALLQRIEALDPKLGAFQSVYPDDALEAGAAADSARMAGHEIGPFHGIPFALKDVIDVAGRMTTGGSMTTAKKTAARTSEVARRLIAAGGILIGKTKTIEFSMGGWGVNQHLGTPRNPWDPHTYRVAGGSSSGSAVAVSTDMVPVALGTDTGGSVRNPSAWCGVVGLKTTHGSLPMDGIIPTAYSLDTVGPITRSVADAAFMFDLMKGAEPANLYRHVECKRGIANGKEESLRGLRVGVLPHREREGMQTSVLDLYDHALHRLRSTSAEIEVFEPPMTYIELAHANREIATAEAYTHHGALMEDADAQVDEDVRQLILPGRAVSARDYIAARLQRQQNIQTFLDRLRGFDALLTPTLGMTPVPLDEVQPRDYPAGFTRPVNYLAMCALTVPMGLTPDGLPGGLQFIARGGEEATALRIGRAYETVRGKLERPPV